MQPATQPLTAKHDDVARLAYVIWQKEGRFHGHDEEHWFQAEAQLRVAMREELDQQAAAVAEQARKPVSKMESIDSRKRRRSSRLAA